jgi:hypothetical protein
MRKALYRRPHDFRRRVVSRIYTSNQDLIKEEQRWLDMIPQEQFGKKFYNRSPKATTPSMLGKKHSSETIEKIRNSQIGKTISEETKEKLRQATIRQFENNDDLRSYLSDLAQKQWKNKIHSKNLLKGEQRTPKQKEAAARHKEYWKELNI